MSCKATQPMRAYNFLMVLIVIIRLAIKKKNTTHTIIKVLGVVTTRMSLILLVTLDWVVMTLHVRIFSKPVSFLTNYCTPHVIHHHTSLQQHLLCPHLHLHHHLILRHTLVILLLTMYKKILLQIVIRRQSIKNKSSHKCK